MTFEYFKKILKLTSIVFTVIVLFQLISGQNLNNQILHDLLGLSLILTLIKVLINKYIIPRDSIFNSLLFILIAWAMVIGSNYVFSWNMSINTIFLTSIQIVVIYILVRIINYQHDKLEVKKMNEILDRNRKNQQQ
ncbi:hypothetical protein [Clostridium sp. BL-8]|uniref:hypothetical protein n=1 Tax=Clostridium sp. BL-8 TaxID=349938 RepID=UPI00098C7DEA|nr:hypothetical protein [Clostridium sp. BL-8]OOM73415.1 hypothetical protein CLOBL_47120 [Clostridium sp. BL-8]